MIAIVLGTRAELIKVFPIMLELKRRKIPYKFIHTGQHNLGKLTKMLGVKNPDITITQPPKKATTKFWTKISKAVPWNLSIVLKIRSALRKIKNLDYVLYHGDTMSAASAAIASSKLLNPGKKYKNVHLEAGLRSGSIFEPFPEEFSRKICDTFSDILFAVSSESEKNLRKEKQKGKIYNVGNTIVDSAVLAYNLAKKKKFKKPKEKYALATIHRHENIKDKNRLSKIADILQRVPIRVILPIHDNTYERIYKFNISHEFCGIDLVKLKDYVEFIYLLKNCSLLLTDGGSVQEESLVFKKPCIILRKRTERVAGLKTGINFLTKLDLEKAKIILKKISSPKWKIRKFKNPYGEHGVSKKIVNILLREKK